MTYVINNNKILVTADRKRNRGQIVGWSSLRERRRSTHFSAAHSLYKAIYALVWQSTADPLYMHNRKRRTQHAGHGAPLCVCIIAVSREKKLLALSIKPRHPWTGRAAAAARTVRRKKLFTTTVRQTYTHTACCCCCVFRVTLIRLRNRKEISSFLLKEGILIARRWIRSAKPRRPLL